MALADTRSNGGSAVRAVIFDFDGTLVDTMPLHFEAYRSVFAEVGFDLTRAEFEAGIGGNARETIPGWLRGRPCRLSPAEMHARKKELVNRLLAERPIPVLETAKLLPAFHGRLPMALASSGSRAGIEIVLRRLDWGRYFDVVVTGEDTPRGKPAPDLFLLAAKGLGIPPENCLVFEDTDAGVAAATNAGMAVFDVRAAGGARAAGRPS
jgi:beta-phosphoglucomutase family hydrolase